MITIKNGNIVYDGMILSSDYRFYEAVDLSPFPTLSEEDEARLLETYEDELMLYAPGLFEVRKAEGNQVAGIWLCRHWGDTGRCCRPHLSEDIAKCMRGAWLRAHEVKL